MCASRPTKSRRCKEALTMTDMRLSYPRLFALLICLALQPQLGATATAQTSAPNQYFVCYVGYTPQQCAVDIAELRKVLTKYPVDALGEWTWVLVRTEDWKRILLDRGLDANGPAFSYLTKHQTFFDGALVKKVSSRGFALRALWHMPIEDLLDFAVRHELGHALCNQREEAKANSAALALKEGKALACDATMVAR